MGRRNAASKPSFRMLKGSPTLKAALPEALKASRRGTGGVVDCGTAEEDGPVTWETPDCPVGRSGRRRTGDPSDAPSAASGPTAGHVAGKPPGTEPTLAQQVRHGRGQTGGMPKQQGSRMAAYER